ncbi:MAG: hypothetical protein ABIE07_01465 [Candidatus Zixiibacteriota bacterium]
MRSFLTRLNRLEDKVKSKIPPFDPAITALRRSKAAIGLSRYHIQVTPRLIDKLVLGNLNRFGDRFESEIKYIIDNPCNVEDFDT